MKIAVCQLNIVWENKSENLNSIRYYVSEAAKNKADLIFFPEMSLTGFSMNIAYTKENGESIYQIKSIAKQFNIAIGIGWVKDCGEKGENVYTVIDNRGEVLSEYTKLHPFSYGGEDKYFSSGNDLVTFEYGGITIGTLICYDLRFPEIFQALSINADLIAVAACWPASRREHWDTLLKARAIENQCYIAGINCVGDIGGLKYSGNSTIIDPNGTVLDSIADREGIIYHQIDNNYKDKILVHSKQDRRPLLYSKFLSK